MPTQKSVQNGLLTNTAAFVSSNVASARVNGSILISDLTKSTSGNTASVSYTVTEAQAPVVTLLELLDSAGEVLTASVVYVPISESAIFNHTITTQEGVNSNG